MSLSVDSSGAAHQARLPRQLEAANSPAHVGAAGAGVSQASPDCVCATPASNIRRMLTVSKLSMLAISTASSIEVMLNGRP
jgi:hypothetical protein